MQQAVRLLLATSLLTALACSSKNSNQCTGDPTLCECSPGSDDCPTGYTCDPTTMLCVASGGGIDASLIDARQIDATGSGGVDANTRPDATAAPDVPGGTVVDTQILTGPDPVTNQTTVRFTFDATVTGSTFMCRIRPAAFAACTTPHMETLLPAQTYIFEVYAVAPDGTPDPTPASFSFSIDTEAPDTTITGGTTGDFIGTTATFTFTSSEPGSTFTCSIDGATAVACTSGQVFDGIGLGPHTITVTAIDAAGNLDPSPATQSWTEIEATPETFVDEHPEAVVDVTTARFTFRSDLDGATFECSLDNAPFAPCTSPLLLSNLTVGPHTLSVRAVSPGGTQKDQTPVIINWTIDTSGLVTSIVSGGEGGIGCATTTFTFGATGMNLTFVCSFDGMAVNPCDPSGTTFTNLQDGTTHTFSVHTIDASNNQGPPVSVTFVVDAAPPTLAITSPMGVTNGTSAVLTFATDPTATITCTLDTVALTPCTSGMTLPTLTNGAHTVAIDAADRCNHADASTTWNADTLPPDVSILGPHAGATTGPVGSIFYDPGDSVSLDCTLDGHAITCPPGGVYTFSGLGSGPHTFTITGTDGVGNTSPTQTLSFTVDADPPVVMTYSVVRPRYGAVTVNTTLSDASSISEIHCILDGVEHACGTGTDGSFTIDGGVAAGPHTLEIYGVDEFGNTGQPVPAQGAPSPHVATHFTEQLEGHLVGIGHDYVTFSGVPDYDAGVNDSNGAFELLMANAVTATQVYPARTPNILGYKADSTSATACSNALTAIAQKLGGVGDCSAIAGFPWYRNLADPDFLANELAHADVFLVHNLNDRSAATALFAKWHDTLLTFLNNGGVVVFYDGPFSGTYCAFRDCNVGWFPFESKEALVRVAFTEPVGGGFPLKTAQPEDPVGRDLVDVFPAPLADPVAAFRIADVVSEVVEPYNYYPGTFHDRQSSLEGDLYGGSGPNHETAPNAKNGFLVNKLSLWNRDHTWEHYPQSTSYAVVFDKPFPDGVRLEARHSINGVDGNYFYNSPVAFQNSLGDTIVRHTGHDGVVVQSLIGGGSVTAGVLQKGGHELTTWFGAKGGDTLLLLDVPTVPQPTTNADNVDFTFDGAETLDRATGLVQPIVTVSVGGNGSQALTINPGDPSAAEWFFAFLRCEIDTDHDIEWAVTLRDGDGPVLYFATGVGAPGAITLPPMSSWSAPDQVRQIDDTFDGMSVEYRISQDSTFSCNPQTDYDGNYGKGVYIDFSNGFQYLQEFPQHLQAYSSLEQIGPNPGQLYADYDNDQFAYFSAFGTAATFTEHIIVHDPSTTAVTTWTSRFDKGAMPDVPVMAVGDDLLPLLSNATATAGNAPRLSFSAAGAVTDADGAYAAITWFNADRDRHRWNFVFKPATSVTAPTLPVDFADYVANSGNVTVDNVILVKSPLLTPAPWADIPYPYPPKSATETRYDSFRFAYPIFLWNLAKNPSEPQPAANDTFNVPPPGETVFANYIYATYLQTTSQLYRLPQ